MTKETLAEMQEIKSFFKAPIKAEGGKPSIVEVDYVGADGITYKGLQFEGYASTKDADRCNDIVLPEAFNDSIKTYMENPVILLQHDHEYPIGSVIEATIDANGLYVKGIVKVDTENIFQSLRTGVIKTMSFGYRVTDYECEKKADDMGNMQSYNIIKSIELFEISLVSVPMNPKAQVKTAKELVGLTDEEYKTYFQINKKDEYSLFKSISDAIATYEKACGGKKPKKDAEEVTETKEEVQEVQEETVEEVKEEETQGDTVAENTETQEEVKEVENVTTEEETVVETTESVEETTETKEAIEPTENTSENVTGESDSTEETAENVVDDDAIVQKVDNIEKSLQEISEKSLSTANEVQESKKSFDEILKSVTTLEETKASQEDVKSLSKQLEDVSESYKQLKQDNEELVKAFSELTELTATCYKALQRITVDGAIQYREEPKAKHNPILDTKLAKAIQSLQAK